MVAVEDRTVSAWQDRITARVKVAGSGPPLVFLHGAYGLQWDPFLDALAGKFTVYAPEHPGTTPGDPDAIKPLHDVWDLVLYHYELFDQLGLKSPAVVGHSFGGMVAAEIAATNPERVSKLVLLDPIGLWLDETPVRNWMALPFAELPSYLFADTNSPLARMMSAAAADESEAMLDARIQIMWSLACTGKFVWPIPDRGLKKRLHRIAAPTLIVWGKSDRIAPPDYADAFAAAIQGATVQLVDGAGHLPHIEQTAVVEQAVAEFLSR